MLLDEYVSPGEAFTRVLTQVDAVSHTPGDGLLVERDGRDVLRSERPGLADQSGSFGCVGFGPNRVRQ